MKNLNTINEYLRQARLSKDTARIKFYSTLKGEVENELKKSNTDEENVIQSLAKQWNKSLLTLKTPEAAFELTLLAEFLPEGLSDSALDELIEKVKQDNLTLFDDFRNGDSKLIGRLTGLVMKSSGGKANADKVVEKLNSL